MNVPLWCNFNEIKWLLSRINYSVLSFLSVIVNMFDFLRTFSFDLRVLIDLCYIAMSVRIHWYFWKFNEQSTPLRVLSTFHGYYPMNEHHVITSLEYLLYHEHVYSIKLCKLILELKFKYSRETIWFSANKTIDFRFLASTITVVVKSCSQFFFIYRAMQLPRNSTGE